MSPDPSRFADPLKDYGFDPSRSVRSEDDSGGGLEGVSLELFNSLIGLSGGLNLFPSDAFDDRSTPGSWSGRCLDWLEGFGGVGASDELDQYDEVQPEALFDGADLPSRLDFYMYGHSDPLSNADVSFGSWELCESHPVKTSLRCPGDAGFELNTNWHERLQWAYRCALPKGPSRRSLCVLGSDEEHELLLELGRFGRSASHGAVKLVTKLLLCGIDACPSDFVPLSTTNVPSSDRFYGKKFANDRQFVHDGIVYTAVVGSGSGSAPVSYTVAKKMYSNDHKGKQFLCSALYSTGSHGEFAMPVQCVVDYFGLRVVAEPLVPLCTSPPVDLLDELFVQCKGLSGNTAMDISTALFTSPDLCRCLKGISSYMHLCSWPIPLDASDTPGFLCEGASASVQRCDGGLHVRHTHEVLPLIMEPNTSCDPFYSLRFRPELCMGYGRQLKCTLRSQVVFEDNPECDMFRDAFQYLQVVLEDCVSRCDTLLDSWDLSHVFHSFGVNLRYLGLAYEKAVYVGLKNLLAAEMVARAVKHLWDGKLQDFFKTPSVPCTQITRSFLRMINDVFGLFAESCSFWSQCVIPEVARHFNLVKLEGISYRQVPHLLLKSALEYNLCILLPPPKDGCSYRNTITADDFVGIKVPPLLGRHLSGGLAVDARSALAYQTHRSMMGAVFPRVSVVCPSSELSMCKVAHKLCNKGVGSAMGDLVLYTNSFGLGFCKHVESKLVGQGYPCDPICVFNTNLSCVNYQQPMTGLNLFCLSECLLQLDCLKRAKLVIYMGYEYLRHRYFEDALRCADYVSEHCPPLCSKRLEARLLALQCHVFMRSSVKCKDLYAELERDIQHLEGCAGLLSLQARMFVCFDSWLCGDFEQCAAYATLARPATLTIAGLPQFEWIPVAVLSLLAHCYAALDKTVDAIKSQRESVRLCNVSHLPRYTLCNQTWVFVEYLLRNDYYEQGCSLSMELIPVLEKEFGSLSVECLRCLYVSAWANHQVGCAHFLHPYLYLSNCDRVLRNEAGVSGVTGSMILDEFVVASDCAIRRGHCENALGLYRSLYERLCLYSSSCRQQLLEYLQSTLSGEECAAVESLPRATRDSLSRALPSHDIDDDEMLQSFIDEGELCHEKLLLVIKSLLTFKTLSLSSQHSMHVAQKLYNAYASQVADSYIWKMCMGGDCSSLDSSSGSGTSHSLSMYGSGQVRQSEQFNSSVSISQKSLPHRGHELRSIEELLLKSPVSSAGAVCEICRVSLEGGSDTPSEWFDRMFDLEASRCGVLDSNFVVALDVLRNFLTPSKRLEILGHVAMISKSDVDSTLTFKELKGRLLEVAGP